MPTGTVAYLSGRTGVTTPMESLLPFGQLVDQCWGLLKQTLTATFPSSSRSHPSPWILIQPGDTTYPGDFWQGAVVPTLSELIRVTPAYQGGWTNPMAKTLVAGYLRRSLTGSVWSSWVDFTR